MLCCSVLMEGQLFCELLDTYVKNSFVSNSVHQDVQKSHSTRTPPRILCFTAHTGNIKVLQSSITQPSIEPSYSATGSAFAHWHMEQLFLQYFMQIHRRHQVIHEFMFHITWQFHHVWDKDYAVGSIHYCIMTVCKNNSRVLIASLHLIIKKEMHFIFHSFIYLIMFIWYSPSHSKK